MVVAERHKREEPSALQAIIIGLDLTKHWFQVHGVDAAGKVVVKRRFRRTEVLEFFRSLEPCLVGMEACATAHYWARELAGFGHRAKLMPPSYVKAYVKRNKNDAADAAAICKAPIRPSMRFVPVKTVDQQAVLMLHRGRALLVRQRTMLVNALRAHMAEFGFIAAKGLAHVEELIEVIDDDETPIPDLALSILRVIVAQLSDTDKRVREFDAKLAKRHREDKTGRLPATVPGVGVMGASAIAATVTDPAMFDSGRDFAAWLGMTPRQNSSGGKERLGGVGKRGDKYIRRLLVGGALAVIRHARGKATAESEWLRGLLARKPVKVLALANKTARIVWVVMKRGEVYQPKETFVGSSA